ncbi:carotenoid oxygenase family protein [Amycolatopsis pithecellobii]|uniref:Dioxygenase n=1 Tax=Amycolatopsis pithecellobii TaxID=664692 RepID=A0A6N7Z4R7_9PSEU|nr:carotenoid oxygenase family protein [Amycolatopsis pithecellobii]MTD55511.1 carotenoid oxygenase [Amycolatopsis pithecellobii]
MTQETTDVAPLKRDGSLYLTGNYAPVHEEVTVFDLGVTGRIPAELSGRLLRNGPNPITPVENPVDYHWFNGTGMVHGVRLRGGKAEWYRNRFVRGSEVLATRGGPPVAGPTRGFDNSNNTNVMKIGKEVYAISEAGCLPLLLSYELETEARSDFGGTMGDAFTAHPRVDPLTGETHAVTYVPQYEKAQYQVVTTEGSVRHLVDIPLPGRPMVHDMGLTTKYAVIMDMPVTFSQAAAMSGDALPYRWDPGHGARVGLLPRHGAAEDIVWCELPGTPYVFHTGNAYDAEDGTVVMDVARYESMFHTNMLSPLDDPARFYRWTINPVTRRVTEQMLDDRAQEFPRHDERLVGRNARYAYTISSDDMPKGFTGLLKHDLRQGTVDSVDYGPGMLTMETVFVPSSEDAAEDDGWLMAYVHDATTERCDVVIRHAQDLATPVATIHLPVRVPFGFHGNWIAD